MRVPVPPPVEVLRWKALRGDANADVAPPAAILGLGPMRNGLSMPVASGLLISSDRRPVAIVAGMEVIGASRSLTLFCSSAAAGGPARTHVRAAA